MYKLANGSEGFNLKEADERNVLNHKEAGYHTHAPQSRAEGMEAFSLLLDGNERLEIQSTVFAPCVIQYWHIADMSSI